jgi:hypothetical protein
MIYHPTISSDTHTPVEIERLNARFSRINKFKKILQETTVDLAELRKISWNGIPEELRPMAWQLLLGYLPTNADRRVNALERKRKEFTDGVKQAFSRGTESLDQVIWHQISIDVPRTNPHLQLYGFEATQRSLERILYVWAIRHPASGYVQGINDLVTPFFQVFLSSYIGMCSKPVTMGLSTDVGQIVMWRRLIPVLCQRKSWTLSKQIPSGA